MSRKNINTTIDENLYLDIQELGLKLKRLNIKKNANDLIEEGMEYILKKYSDVLEKRG